MVSAVYIHIPFCLKICSYCDFCKQYYNSELVDKYLVALEKEINQKYQFENIKTIYIGGGTPSCLNFKQLEKLFDIIKIFKTDYAEVTIEANADSLDMAKLELFKKNNVNRLSIGFETNNSKFLNYLNRTQMNMEVIKQIKKMNFNLNLDLIYAIPNQTLEDLELDLECILKIDPEHISTYSLIIEPNTMLYINNAKYIDEDLDYAMYKLIIKKLKKYRHYETSNFSKKSYESKHNLVYWNNLEYYGFGLGASGYLNDVRYENTRSIDKYLKEEFVLDEEVLDISTKISNEYILGFRKLEGISITDFEKKYNISIENDIVKKLLQEKKLKKGNNHIKINPKFLYRSNMILREFI